MAPRKTSLIGTLLASAAFGQGFMTPAHAAEPRIRYEEAIAEVLASLHGGGVQDPAQAPITFDIPPDSLREAVVRFEQATGLSVTITAGLDDIPSSGVRGRMTVAQGLEALLDRTNVGFRFASPSSVVLDIKPRTEFVEVVGGAPAISSPRFTAPLRDIPQTIAVIPADVIEAQGATSLRDVLRNVPGVTFQAGEGGGGLPGDSFTMRGFSAGNDIFVDGVRDTGGYSRDAFNLEQVEIVKGPSSSIAGRGSTGGAINQVTKSPHMAESTSGSSGFGNADFRRVTADLNHPVHAFGDGAAFRLTALWTESGVAGRDVVENSSWGVAPSLAFGLDGTRRVTLKYLKLVQDNVPDYGLPWGSYPGYPTGAFEASPAIDQSNFYGLREYDFEDIESDIATGDIGWDLNPRWTLRNISRFGKTTRDSAITAPRPPNRQLQRRTMGNEQWANQSTLTARLGQGAVRHDLVTGLDLSRELTDNQNSAQSTNQPAVTIENPNPGDRPIGAMPPNTGNPAETRLNQVGVYAFDTLSVGSRWQFTGGLRVDAIDVGYEQTTLATGGVTRLDAQDTMVSWRAGAVYKPAVNGSVYVGAGTSFNPSVDAAATGAALSNAPNSANNPNLDPERTRNLEVGTKWDLAAGRLAVTGALFRTEKTNARTRNANSDPFVLTGRQLVSGVELSASGQIINRWTVLAAYAYMNSDIGSSVNAAEEGNNLTLTPEHTLSIWTTYGITSRLTVGGGAQYMDAVFRNTLNTQQVPSYWLGSAVASYTVNQMLTLRLNVQNLTNEEYVDRVGGGHYIPGPKRQAMLTADIGF